MTSDSSTEQAARAEAERRYPLDAFPATFQHVPAYREAFSAGAAWALAHQAPAAEHMESAVEVLRYPGGKDGMTVGRCTCGYSTSPGTESGARKALAQHLAAKAPATEDEAAEVEWGVRHGNGIVDDDFGGVRERAESFADRHDLTLVSRTVGPWREVSS